MLFPAPGPRDHESDNALTRAHHGYEGHCTRLAASRRAGQAAAPEC